MATALTASIYGQVLGPVSLSVTEEAVTLTLTQGIKGFMMAADGAWLYHSTAAQSDLPQFSAWQWVVLNSQSASTFVFSAKVASSTAKLYIIPVG